MFTDYFYNIYYIHCVKHKVYAAREQELSLPSCRDSFPVHLDSVTERHNNKHIEEIHIPPQSAFAFHIFITYISLYWSTITKILIYTDMLWCFFSKCLLFRFILTSSLQSALIFDEHINLNTNTCSLSKKWEN